MRLSQFSFLLTSLIASVAAPVRAQSTDSIWIVTSALRDAAAKNQIVRVQTDSASMSGRVYLVSDSVFRVSRRTVLPARVVSLKIRATEQDRLLNGFLIGAGVGALTLGPLGVEFAESMGEHKLSTWEKTRVFIGSAIFGSLIGTFVDAASEGRVSWLRVFPRQ